MRKVNDMIYQKTVSNDKKSANLWHLSLNICKYLMRKWNQKIPTNGNGRPYQRNIKNSEQNEKQK